MAFSHFCQLDQDIARGFRIDESDAAAAVSDARFLVQQHYALAFQLDERRVTLEERRVPLEERRLPTEELKLRVQLQERQVAVTERRARAAVAELRRADKFLERHEIDC